MVNLAFTLLGLVVAITVHECAHAWTADRLGDPTARQMGRVSLNPIVHLDPLGSVMMLVTAITGVGIGWGKPVPVSSYRLKYGSRLGGGLVSLAGPVSNVSFAVVLGLIWRLMPFVPYLSTALFVISLVNITIAMFNLLPLPPLDGFGVLMGLLSVFRGQWAWKLSEWFGQLQRFGPMLLILELVVTQFMGIPVLGWLIGPPTRFFQRVILGI
ncbi:MAG: site-2 protease family protein [Chloroflexi bacterium]|nr:site-2 protease family protein [Chloroflexota bacterium]